jgi:hypothetical protein
MFYAVIDTFEIYFLPIIWSTYATWARVFMGDAIIKTGALIFGEMSLYVTLYVHRKNTFLYLRGWACFACYEPVGKREEAGIGPTMTFLLTEL